MTTTRRHRLRGKTPPVVGLSLGFQRDELLARGLGPEHLREMLLALARPLLRQGASLTYGGSLLLDEGPDRPNFLLDLLRLVSAEQEDNSLGGPDTDRRIGSLFNPSAWPHYLALLPRVEARWINCCRIVRVTQAMAGVEPAAVVPDKDAASGSDRARFNAALALSAMRRVALDGVLLEHPGVPPEPVPRTEAAVMIAGKVDGYVGFAPGIFEEALLAMERGRPLYVLGGFGGAARVIADALLAPAGAAPPAAITLDWHTAHTPDVAGLIKLAEGFQVPAGTRTTEQILTDLRRRTAAAASGLADVLKNGLSDDENRVLLRTRDPHTAVRLVRKGLAVMTPFVELSSWSEPS